MYDTPSFHSFLVWSTLRDKPLQRTFFLRPRRRTNNVRTWYRGDNALNARHSSSSLNEFLFNDVSGNPYAPGDMYLYFCRTIDTLDGNFSSTFSDDTTNHWANCFDRKNVSYCPKFSSFHFINKILISLFSSASGNTTWIKNHSNFVLAFLIIFHNIFTKFID